MNKGKIRDIIFIEDDELDYEIYVNILSERFPEIKVVRVESIDEDFLNGYKVESTLIILDINLRGVDGINHYVEKIKSKGFVTFTHTSSDNPSDITRSRDAGIYAYFQKKSGKEEILKQIELMVNFFNENFIKEFYTSSVNSDYLKKITQYEAEVNRLSLEVNKLRSNVLYPEDNRDKSVSESDELFIRISKSFSAGIYIYDFEKNTNIYMNSQYKQITGHDLEDINSLRPEDFLALFHPDDLEKVLGHMKEVSTSSGDEVIKLEYRFKHKNGHWIKLLSLDRVFDRTSDGTPKTFIGSFFEL